MLAIAVPAQAAVFATTIKANALSIELLNTSVFAEEGILDTYTPLAIKSAAKQTGLKVDLHNNKIVMPTEPNSIKALLQLLNESRYLGQLCGQAFVTNSQRPV